MSKRSAPKKARNPGGRGGEAEAGPAEPPDASVPEPEAGAPPPVPLVAPEGGAVVRMYCTGLGDCFLLGLPAPGGGTARVLIDFGVWKGTKGARDTMRRIAEDIRDTVKGQALDLLVVTHPHWDHLSGFALAWDVFREITVKEVWLPWTEDNADPDARRLADETRLALDAAVAVAGQLRSLSPERALAADGRATRDAGRSPRRLSDELKAARDIEEVLKFFGVTPPHDVRARAENQTLAGVAGNQTMGFAKVAAAAAPAGPDEGGRRALDVGLAAGPTTDDLMLRVRGLAPPGKLRYLRPSARPVADTPFSGVTVYALGPPTDLTLLSRDNPSTKAGQTDVYLTPRAFGLIPPGADAALLAAAYHGPAPEDPVEAADQKLVEEMAHPFDRPHRITEWANHPDPEVRAFFGTYFAPGGDEGDDPGWRRIQTEWLEAAGQIALKLDGHVNNRSLVLAFELGSGDDAPVLLFVGDAQVGNWVSWHDLDAEGALARGLLKRTVLYKVGHHASHNATHRAKGLDLMTRTDRLVAMIPVSETEAHKPKGGNPEGWDMPYGKLLDKLVEKTQGRVIRSDKGVRPYDPAQDPKDWEDAWNGFQAEVLVERREVAGAGPGKGAEPALLFVQYTVRL